MAAQMTRRDAAPRAWSGTGRAVAVLGVLVALLAGLSILRGTLHSLRVHHYHVGHAHTRFHFPSVHRPNAAASSDSSQRRTSVAQAEVVDVQTVPSVAPPDSAMMSVVIKQSVWHNGRHKMMEQTVDCDTLDLEGEETAAVFECKVLIAKRRSAASVAALLNLKLPQPGLPSPPPAPVGTYTPAAPAAPGPCPGWLRHTPRSFVASHLIPCDWLLPFAELVVRPGDAYVTQVSSSRGESSGEQRRIEEDAVVAGMTELVDVFAPYETEPVQLDPEEEEAVAGAEVVGQQAEAVAEAKETAQAGASTVVDEVDDATDHALQYLVASTDEAAAVAGAVGDEAKVQEAEEEEHNPMQVLMQRAHSATQVGLAEQQAPAIAQPDSWVAAAMVPPPPPTLPPAPAAAAAVHSATSTRHVVPNSGHGKHERPRARGATATARNTAGAASGAATTAAAAKVEAEPTEEEHLEAALNAGELLSQIKTIVATAQSTKRPLPTVRKATPSKKAAASSRGRHVVSSHKVHPPPLRAIRPLLMPPPPYIEPLDEHEDYSEDMNHQHDPLEDPFAETEEEEEEVAAEEEEGDSARAGGGGTATARSNITGVNGGGSPGRLRYNPLSGRLFLDATVPAVARALARQPPHRAPWLRLKWPRHGNRIPVHVQLHSAQFYEDGYYGGRATNANRNNVVNSPHLNYLTHSFTTPVVSRYFFHRALIQRLPRQSTHWKYHSCAVVSNSGSLLEKELGAEIDQHDAVFRINYPPVVGFEKHVGTVTSFDLVNHHHLQLMSNPPGYERHPFLDYGAKTFRAPPNKPYDGKSMLVLIESTNSEGWRFYSLPKIFAKYPNARIMALSPDFVVAADDVWRRISNDLVKEGEQCVSVSEDDSVTNPYNHTFVRRPDSRLVCKPTSGWFALSFAAQICDEVHLYGFSDWSKDDPSAAAEGGIGKGGAKYHYFDEVEGVTDVHSFELSKRIYETLAVHYPIFLH